MDYHAAEKMCQQGNGGYGSGVVDAHLASVRTKGEMQIVKRLCRGYRYDELMFLVGCVCA